MQQQKIQINQQNLSGQQMVIVWPFPGKFAALFQKLRGLLGMD